MVPARARGGRRLATHGAGFLVENVKDKEGWARGIAVRFRATRTPGRSCA